MWNSFGLLYETVTCRNAHRCCYSCSRRWEWSCRNYGRVATCPLCRAAGSLIAAPHVDAELDNQVDM